MSVVAACATAQAGAFLQPPNTGQLIVTGRFEQSNRFFSRNGRNRRVRNYRKFELQAWAEYGVSEAVTLIFAPSLARTSTSARPTPIRRESKFQVLHGNLELGARLSLARSLQSAASLQATIRLAQQFSKAPVGVLLHEPHELDVRLLYSRNFQLGRKPAYVDIQSGYRLRTGIADEWRTDVTLGILLYPKWTILLQNFNIVSLGGRRFRGKRQHKLQVSFVYALTKYWSVQAGAFTTIAGRSARKDRGLVAAVWRRF